jgi:uncharacterized protein
VTEIDETQTIIWRRLDRPGHESARLSFAAPAWRLAGTAVFGHDGKPCRLDYEVICDAQWQTRSGRVSGWVGEQAVEIKIWVDASRCWWLNRTEVPEVAGCLDLDLNFSPSTNLLPIRRLKLAAGQSAGVRAAWLRFPGFTLEPLEQTYRHTAPDVYRYESAGGAFTADLRVNPAGFVTDYPNFWTVERGGSF